MPSLHEASFVICDVETSGKDAATADLLEVAALHLDYAGRSFARFESLVRPTAPVPHDSSGIHNLTDEDLADAPSREVVERALQRFVPADSIILAHHAVFDSVVLRNALGDRRWLCTERLAHHVDPDALNFKLGTLRYRYGHRTIDTAGLKAHRAMADVLVLARVFGTLLDYYEQGSGNDVTADDAETQLVSFAAAPYLVKTILFGKHAGTAIADLPLDYLQWGVGARGFTDDPDMLHTFRSELARRRGQFEFATPSHSLADRVGAV